MNKFVSRYLKERAGASAAEFALVVIPFVSLVLGIIGTCLVLYANQNLQYAAEAGARCASVMSVICSNNAATQNYALARYVGPGISPSFTASRTGCGHTVTGTGTFPLNAGLVSISIPLSASACFP